MNKIKVLLSTILSSLLLNVHFLGAILAQISIGLFYNFFRMTQEMMQKNEKFDWVKFILGKMRIAAFSVMLFVSFYLHTYVPPFKNFWYVMLFFVFFNEIYNLVYAIEQSKVFKFSVKIDWIRKIFLKFVKPHNE